MKVLVVLALVIHAVEAASGRAHAAAASTTLSSKTPLEEQRAKAAPIGASAVPALRTTASPGASRDVSLVRRGGSVGKARGVASVAGGVLSHLVLGTLYCWGSFQAYAPEKLQFFDGLGMEAHPGATKDCTYVMPIQIVAQCFGLKMGGYLIKQYGPRMASIFGSLLVASGVFLSSFQTRLLPFVLCYAVLGGLGIGSAYNSAMVAGWSWFPSSKGLVNGCVLTGFGSGAFIFNLVGTSLVNPDGAAAPFPDSVFEAFPKMLRGLAAMYAVVALSGSAFIKSAPADPDAKPATTESKAKVTTEATFGEAVSSPKFWVLWSMIIMTATPVLNVANMYKSFATGYPELNSDVFQSLMGGFGAIFNGLGRLFWGSVVDAYGFERPYGILAAMEIALLQLLPMEITTKSKTLFGVVLCGLFFCLGGNFCMFPTVNAKMFGTLNAPEIYSVLFTGFATAAIGGNMLTSRLLKSIGWTGLLNVMSAMCVGGLALINAL